MRLGDENRDVIAMLSYHEIRNKILSEVARKRALKHGNSERVPRLENEVQELRMEKEHLKESTEEMI